MPIDQETLGRRLREAREASNKTQEYVAAHLELPRTAVAQFEAGKRSVSSLELLKLSKLYERDFADFFKEVDATKDPDPFVVLHRLAPGLEDDPEVAKQVRHCLFLCREGTELEAMLGRNERVGPPAYELPVPKTAGEAIRQGAYVAKQERQRVGLGEAPIADISDLLNAQGVWATGVRLPDHMSGLFLKHALTGMVVIANFDHARTRKRFSYAHEYAHALIDRDRGGTVTTQENAGELVEKRANAFAAAFLMPAEGVRHYLHTLNKGQPSRSEQSVFDVATEGRIEAQLRPEPGSQTLSYQDVARVADWFKVSYKAAVYRLRSLNIFSQGECDGLLGQETLANDFKRALELFDDSENKQRAPKQDRELVGQLVHLVIEAYRRGEISRGRVLGLAETLEIDGRTLLELSQAARAD